jgi:phosphatidylglycerophosphate synthase
MPGKDRNYYIINGITLYRLLSAPVMVVLIFTGHERLFSYMLPVSFFTDLIDGTLARKFRVTSVFGSRLDSVADDLTILAGIIGVFALKGWFIRDNLALCVVMIVLLATQNVMALIRYRKISSFHTYSAKAAAVVQGMFLILLFLLPEPLYWLFYLAAFASIIDLAEEIILVLVLPEWKTDVKGLYWVLKDKRSRKKNRS